MTLFKSCGLPLSFRKTQPVLGNPEATFQRCSAPRTGAINGTEAALDFDLGVHSLLRTIARLMDTCVELKSSHFNPATSPMRNPQKYISDSMHCMFGSAGNRLMIASAVSRSYAFVSAGSLVRIRGFMSWHGFVSISPVFTAYVKIALIRFLVLVTVLRPSFFARVVSN